MEERNDQIQRVVGEEPPRTTGDGGNLKSDELAGDPELEAISRGQHRMMSPERSPAVGRVQTALDKLGYLLPKFGIDEKFGSETGAAVTHFKKDSGVQPSDPVVGKRTIRGLDAGVAGSGQGGSNSLPPGESPCECSTSKPVKDREIHLNLGSRAVKVFQKGNGAVEFGSIIIGPRTDTKIRCPMYSVLGHQKRSGKGLINFVNYDGDFGFHSNYWWQKVKTKSGAKEEIVRIPGSKSHGCARLHDKDEKSTDSGDSKKFHDLVQNGDCVRVYKSSIWETPTFGDCKATCHKKINSGGSSQPPQNT